MRVVLAPHPYRGTSIVAGVDDDELEPEPEPEPGERRLNIHLDSGDIGGVYANFANVSFSSSRA